MGTGVSRPNSREHTPASMRPSTQEGAASNLEVASGSGGGGGAAKEVTFGRLRSARGDDEVREALKERGCVLDGDAVDAMRQRASSISIQVPQGMDEIDIIMELFKNDQKTVQGEKFLHKTKFGEEEGGKVERPNLEHLLGSVDDVLPLRCMYAEHCMSELADLEFDTAWGARTTPAKEWEYVVGVGGLDLETWTLREPRERPESPRGKMERQKAVGRNKWSVLGLHHKNKAFVAKLTVEEVCALRLLTGPMSSVYNRALRSGDEGKAGKWANTMLVAVSGIVKLSAVSAPVPSGKLYRVLNKNNRVTSQDFEEMKDAQGYVWEINRGFMSATSSLDVARGKSLSQIGSTVILEMTVSTRLSCPADLTWLSQFEHEKEYMYAPGAHMELLSSIPRRHKTHTHYSVAVTRNTEAQTLEMAALNPSRAIQTVAKRSFCGLRNTLLASFGAAWGENVSSKALDDVRKSPSEWFLNDWRCAVAVDEIVRARDRERRLVVQEVVRRGDEAAKSGDMQEAAMLYMSGYSIVEGLWSEGETGRGDALLELQGRLVTSMESGGFALPGKEKGRLAKLSFQSGEHKKAHSLFAGLVKEMKDQVGDTGGGADAEKKAELEEVLLGAGEASKAVGRFSESTGYFREIIDQFEAPPPEQGLSAFLTTAPDMTGGVDTAISSPRDEEKRRVSYAQALRGMGDVLASKGDDDEATAYYERAGRQISKVLGLRHPEMATLLVSQSWALKRLGNYEEALHNLRRALSIRRKAFGSKHALVGECLYGIASVLKMLGSFDEAMEGYEQALQVMRDAHGDEHVEVAKVLSDMGTMSELHGLHAEALQYFDEACQIREGVLGSGSCEVANGLMRTAKLFEKLRNFQDSLVDAGRAHGIFMEAFGENDYRTMAAHKMVERLSASQGETRIQKENAFDNSGAASTQSLNRRSAGRSLVSQKSSASLASRPMIV